VTCVDYQDASDYAEWLKGKTGKPYRLPTEAEWEYACRAGTKTARFWGDDREGAAAFANVADRSLAAILKQEPDPEEFFQHDDGYPFSSLVGGFRPNQFGLYDMLGNVWEWCRDHWAPNYRNAPKDGTVYTTSDSDASRVLRGAAWSGNPRYVRAGTRDWDDPRIRINDIGFRVARALPPLES
jgi:formylglycine-generating enzyme required for sulfatase activity